MGNRTIDWEIIEKDFSAGIMSLRQVAEHHGVAFSSLRRVAKERSWRRDLTQQIKARAAQKIASIDVSALVEQSADESAHRSAQTLNDAVEMAATIQANIIIKHRCLIGREIERADSLENQFDIMVGSLSDIKDLSLAAQVLKSMIDCKAKLITLDRQNYKIDDSVNIEDMNKRVNFNISFV